MTIQLVLPTKSASAGSATHQLDRREKVTRESEASEAGKIPAPRLFLPVGDVLFAGIRLMGGTSPACLASRHSGATATRFQLQNV